MANLQAGVILPIVVDSNEVVFRPHSLEATARPLPGSNTSVIISIAFIVDNASISGKEFNISEDEFSKDPKYKNRVYFKFDPSIINLNSVEVLTMSVKQPDGDPLQLDLSFTSKEGKIGGAGIG